MAKAKKKQLTPPPVQLRCEDLGETRSFAADHAERILAAQVRNRRGTGPDTWQPVAAADTQ